MAALLGLTLLSAPAQALGEDRSYVIGTIVRLHVESSVEAAPRSFVKTGTALVDVPGALADGIPQGASVRAEVVAGRVASLSRIQAGVARAKVFARSVTREVTVVVARWPGLADDGVTAAQVAAGVGASDAYWNKASDGRIRFKVVKSFDGVQVRTPACVAGDALSNAYGFWKEAADAAKWQPGQGRHLVVYFPRTTACASAGLGTIGSSASDGGMVWSNGSVAAGVIGHELGHNLGLGHSSVLDCLDGGRVTGESGTCGVRSYLDLYDIMGMAWGGLGEVNAVHAEQLGLLVPTVVDPSGGPATVVLSALGGRTGARAVAVPFGGKRYVLEYRAKAGLDRAALIPGSTAPGVLIHRADPSNDSLLLDADPSTPDTSIGDSNFALRAGGKAQIRAGGGAELSIAVRSQDAVSATVVISLGAAGQPPAPSKARLTTGPVAVRASRIAAPVVFGSPEKSATIVAGTDWSATEVGASGPAKSSVRAKFVNGRTGAWNVRARQIGLVARTGPGAGALRVKRDGVVMTVNLGHLPAGQRIVWTGAGDTGIGTAAFTVTADQPGRVTAVLMLS